MKANSQRRVRAMVAMSGLMLATICSLGAPLPAASQAEGSRRAPRAATFSSPTLYRIAANGTAFDIASGDFTGTKIKDIVVANGAGGSVSLLAGRGDGTFAPAVTVYSSPGKSVTAIATGDFNGDGHLDFAVVTEGGAAQDIVILLGDGHRHFRQSATAPLRFLAQVGPLVFGGMRSIALGAFTRRGTLDAVVTDAANYISVFFGDGHGGFSGRQDLLAAALPTSVLVANLYGHGLSDIGVLDNDSSSVYTFANHSDGTFAPRQRTPLGALDVNALPVSLAAGDLRRKGRIDLFAVLSDTNGPACCSVGKILLSDGRGSYAKPAGVPIAGSVDFPAAGAIADFNGDGIPDVVSVAEAFPRRNDVIVLPGIGDGTFSTAAQTTVKITSGNNVLLADKIIVDDFNSDGKPDIAVAID
ncbi:MAG: VCBS repeat-containing protein, partial [Candidatus Eremiobacteraeota bacterium]|nr:VCBS repeat-containing protein [Candidatus Eremiobacteraeota bacterium]